MFYIERSHVSVVEISGTWIWSSHNQLKYLNRMNCVNRLSILAAQLIVRYVPDFRWSEGCKQHIKIRSSLHISSKCVNLFTHIWVNDMNFCIRAHIWIFRALWIEMLSRCWDMWASIFCCVLFLNILFVCIYNS